MLMLQRANFRRDNNAEKRNVLQLSVIRYQLLEVGEEILFFDGAIDVPQVIAKCVTGVGCALLQLLGEVQLCARNARPALIASACRRSLSQMFRAVASNSSTFSELTKRQPSSSAKTTSLACTSKSPKRARRSADSSRGSRRSGPEGHAP